MSMIIVQATGWLFMALGLVLYWFGTKMSGKPSRARRATGMGTFALGGITTILAALLG
jgi:hypothetical protein